MLGRHAELKLNISAGIPTQEGLGKGAASCLLNIPTVDYAGRASVPTEFLSTDEQLLG